ncbi:hypothetical protein [Lysobacter capsici]|uniref:hypothetical protein n=1 Tax=Lysobacter capsici TaxID=435897 RepID=UPI001C000B5B|nr:hypothetical protein [Lysobacter capsici]QWF19268.1 hypothetical protein KME82_11275 [Lysobacter capsici]
MTAQIEPNPRQGRELSLPMTWADYLAMTVCYAAVGVLGWAVLTKAPLPAVIAVVVAAIAWIVGAILEGCRRADP